MFHTHVSVTHSLSRCRSHTCAHTLSCLISYASVVVNLHLCASLLLYLSFDNKLNTPTPSSPLRALYGLYGPPGPKGRAYVHGPHTGLRAETLKLKGLYGPTGLTGRSYGRTGPDLGLPRGQWPKVFAIPRLPRSVSVCLRVRVRVRVCV